MKHDDSSALHLAALVESSDDAIISEDLAGNILTWNRAAERTFGYTAEEALGRLNVLIVPESRQEEERSVLARVRKGEAVRHFETVRESRNGALVQVSLTVSPIVTPDGTIVGVSRIARDITWQKAAEREAFRLAALVESSEDAIVSKSLDGIVLSWNRAAERMFGYPAAEAIGRSVRLIIPPDRQDEEDRVLARVRAGLAVHPFETVRRRKDGTLVDISLAVSPIRNREGVIIGASKIARDISAQKRLTADLEAANRVKDEFLATLSHELRTPLNAVLGYARMIRAGHFGDDRRNQAMEVIERNANLLTQLVSDVLDISSTVTGKIRLNTAPSDVVAIMQSAIDVVQPSIEAKRLTLDVTGIKAPIVVVSDPDRMRQVFWNLLANAVKFTPEGGRIAVDLLEEDGEAVVTVTDSGVGIGSDFLPFVFQRFRRSDNATRHGFGGLGLGLALVRHFVELHGGRVQAASEGEGRGSTFTVRLPLAGRGPAFRASVQEGVTSAAPPAAEAP
jgi:PAS domain S-box-containing protein